MLINRLLFRFAVWIIYKEKRKSLVILGTNCEFLAKKSNHMSRTGSTHKMNAEFLMKLVGYIRNSLEFIRRTFTITEKH